MQFFNVIIPQDLQTVLQGLDVTYVLLVCGAFMTLPSSRQAFREIVCEYALSYYSSYYQLISVISQEEASECPRLQFTEAATGFDTTVSLTTHAAKVCSRS